MGIKKTGNKEQFDRYKAALPNLIFTDYLHFYFYQYTEFITEVEIARIQDGSIVAITENFATFTNLLKNFCLKVDQTIKSPKKLAEMMAGKARLLSDVIEKSLLSDETHDEDSTLKDQMMAFKSILIHDITPKGFADVYAQTIAYGMFAARLHDTSINNFSRQEAAELIPKSNPFLRKLFGYIAGPDLDDRIKFIVDSLVEIFLACNVQQILQSYGRTTKTEDPIIHFYETFLSEYDPDLRKTRGVWYTPKPVVNFIVRAVDDILKTEFELRDGLADSSKTTIKVNLQKTDKRYKENIKTIDQEVHRVQILDPATGTGTFLAETIKLIHKQFEGQSGIWSNYVEKHLIPRLNGFELLMASYAMAHLKLDLLLTETGYKPTSNQRLRVFLTNSLEQASSEVPNLFMAQWLTEEAQRADFIKRDTPVMCIIGNPPYSGESANKRNPWIKTLMEDYKKEPGGIEKLKEQNSKFLNDDYVKFLRFGQYFVEKNGSGVLAFINPHGFLDNPTFRGMRWNLLKTYDKIYTIDLHGNSNKKEISPDGKPDINVFDIQQGVSINIFIKTGKKQSSELGKVFHFEIYGKREDKYTFLNEKRINEIDFTALENIEPNYFFKEKNWKIGFVYNDYLSLNELFVKSTIGIQSHRDELVISFNKSELSDRFKQIFTAESKNSFIKKYNVKESQNWSLNQAIIKTKEFNDSELKKLCYRAFDDRFIYYNDNFVDRTRRSVGKEINDNNYVINFPKIVKVDWNHSLITKSMPTAISMDINGTYFAPLYCNSANELFEPNKRTPNLNIEIVNQIALSLDLVFTNEKEICENTFAPIDILDYIYGVLHSPTYRKRFNEFLKDDFPRVPYPKDKETFWQLVKLGGELRQIHLLESPIVEKRITQYPINGNNVVTKTKYEGGNVFVNETQYFENVPEVAWNFYIGGYQPAQKWLKDRKDRELEHEDVWHYQKIIVALIETDRIMKEIDMIEI